MRRVYLDSNATTPVSPEVFEAMRPCFTEKFGNASSIHQDGQEARAAVEQARAAVAKLLGCRAAEIVFTSGGTESDNLAIFGVTSPGDHVITSMIEHSAVSASCARLKKLGCEVTHVPVDGRGLVDPEEVRQALRPNTKLITIMMANNETGVLQPVEEIGRIAAEADVWFHTDAVQAAGKVPIQVEKIGCDLMAISGHKFHAPKGVGALYVRRGTLLMPHQCGGRQERGRRSGTENVPGIVALGKAAELAAAGLENGAMRQIGQWRDDFEIAILETVSDTGVNGRERPACRTPRTSTLTTSRAKRWSLLWT